MKKSHRAIIILLLAWLHIGTLQAQTYSDDFENQYTWFLPWLNLHIVADSSSNTTNYVCICDTMHEYGLGFSIEARKEHPHQNINCKYQFLFKAKADTKAEIVVSVDNETGNQYWNAYHLNDFVHDTAEWSLMSLELKFPFDYVDKGTIRTYVWNRAKETLYFDNAQLVVEELFMPSFTPTLLHDSSFNYNPYLLSENLIPVVEYIDANGDTLTDPKVMETKFDDGLMEYHGQPHSWIIGSYADIETTFKEDIKLLRLAFILPLPEGELTVYRRNQHIDSTDYQKSYYLDREGFSIRNDSIEISTYHNTGISSLQLDTENRYACFNIDYWRDHPLLHYPLLPDTSNVFENISFREIKKGDVLKGKITVFNHAMDDLPRLMPVWDGYQSAFIFTEHADWTDLRTHRAVLFGNEHITQPEDAVGGFCHFNIPVTKSVFYWNPDLVTNDMASKGNFFGLHANIKGDKEYFNLLKAIKKEGFEICLHTPEQYTTVPDEFPKAMRFMRRHFGTKTWIDHGYNNGPEKNREDLVCDGLLPDSPYFAAKLWKKNGVRYLWNAYYEENRMESFNFDCHFVQPYDGYGDALPNRQITTLPDGSSDFLLWSTPSTLEMNEGYQWYYFFDSIRLQRLVGQHNVFITHIYPAWTDPWRGAWQFDENGTVVAMQGLNYALDKIARLRNEKKMLPTTIPEYLSYYEKLQNIEYLVLDNSSIKLTNRGEAIEGLTLLCTKPINVEGKVMDFRKVDEGYLVWFDINKNETIIIRHKK